jgi:hypothetical protein
VTAVELDTAEPRAVHGVGRMVDTVGVPVVVLVEDVRGRMVPADPCLIVGEITIRYGRADVSTPVAEPASATVTLIAPTGDAGAAYPLRRRLMVEMSPGAVAYWGVTGYPTRFAGRITEVVAASDPALGAVVTVTAAGPTADLGRVMIGDAPWPQQSAQDRVIGVSQLAGLSAWGFGGRPPALIPPPVVLARDVDRRPALDLIATYADLGLCYVSDKRSEFDQVWVLSLLDLAAYLADVIALPDPQSAAYLTLDACELYADWSAAWTMAGMLNRLSVGYGVAPEGGEQPRAIFTDDESLARFGLMDGSVASDLATLNDAETFALARFDALAAPTPVLPELRCDLWRTLSVAQGLRLLEIAQTYLIGLSNLPAQVPINSAGLVVLNGYSERITPDSWEFALAVYDPIPGGAILLWNMPASEVTWDGYPTSVTWDDIDSWTGPTGGSWAEIDQTLAWAAVPPTLSWLDVPTALNERSQ